jgi:tetratricopeptide (TPR) repeat protein
MDPRPASSPLDSGGVTRALPPSAASLLPGAGDLLGGRYRLGSLLGQGGMGQVWRGRDVALDREVAVKLLAAPDVREGRERFLREARVAAALNHPHIVSVHDLGEESGCLFLVMELVSGGSLRDREPPAIDTAVEIARQLCAALGHAHAHGLVHRDVKPANVLVAGGPTSAVSAVSSGAATLTGSGSRRSAGITVKLADLGLAVASGATRITREGAIVGTVAYLAPEQAIGRVVDGRADLYSLGVLLYELVTGRLPFAGTPVALISQHLHAPVVPPRSLRPDLDPALEAVILRLLAKDPAQRFATAEETAAALARAVSTSPSQVLMPATPVGVLDALVRGRLVGRDAELAQLRELWGRAAQGSGHLALIGGEAGAGKTRLARELAVYARLAGAAVLSGGCYEFEATTPYLPFVEVLRRWVHDAPAADLERTLGDQAAVLARLAPELEVRLGPLVPAVALSSHEERLRLFDHCTRWLQAVAAPRGALLLLDDLQWADQGTLQLLHYLLRNLGSAPVLALATFREEEVGAEHPLALLLAELNRERLATRVHLGRLDAAATGDVLAALFGQDSVSGELTAAVYRESEGNPFFVEETVKGLIDQGVIYRRDNEWCRDEAAEIRLPEGVRAAIARRLERLSAACREALQAAAALGKSFRFGDLAVVGVADDEALLDALDEARRSQLVEEEGSEDRFAFTHDKIREVLYGGMNPIRRRRLHLRLGESLLASWAATAGRHAEALAHHFHEGGDAERALTWAAKAAEQAEAVYAHDEALDSYRRAVGHAHALGRPDREAELEKAMGEVCFRAGAMPESAAHYERALELTADPRRRLELAALVGNAYVQYGDRRGLPRLEEALAGLDAATAPLERARALRSRARYEHLAGGHRKAIELLVESLALSEPHGEVDDLVHTYAWLCGAYQHLADYGNSDGWAYRIIALAQERGTPAAASLGWEFLSENANGHGRFREAIEFARRNGELGARVHDLSRVAWAEYATCWAHHALGELAAARAALERSLAAAERTGDVRVRRLCDSYEVMLASDFGEAATAELATHALAAADATGQLWPRLEARRGAAYHELAVDNPTRVVELAEQCIAMIAGTDSVLSLLHLGPTHAEALVRLGRGEEARVVLARTEQIAAVGDGRFASVSCRFVRGLLLAREADLGEAAVAMDEAIAGFAAMGCRLVLARALWARGALRSRRGEAGSDDHQRAAELLLAAGAEQHLSRLRANPAF